MALNYVRLSCKKESHRQNKKLANERPEILDFGTIFEYLELPRIQ